jgi:hypothetical protein
MSHKWDGKVERHGPYTVTCLRCGVTVERVVESGRFKNYHVIKGGERRRGLAPSCPATEEANGRQVKLTDTSLKLFIELADDAKNWHNVIPTDGNVKITKKLRGNVTNLKRAGLVVVRDEGGSSWLLFTPKGEEYAGELGIDVEALA